LQGENEPLILFDPLEEFSENNIPKMYQKE
jgi:hypothetical protein